MVTRRVRGRGAEARDASDAAVVGVAGCGLIMGGVATMAELLMIGVAGLSVLLTFADDPDPIADTGATALVAVMPAGISIFIGFSGLASLAFETDNFTGEVSFALASGLLSGSGGTTACLICSFGRRRGCRGFGEPKLTAAALPLSALFESSF